MACMWLCTWYFSSDDEHVFMLQWCSLYSKLNLIVLFLLCFAILWIWLLYWIHFADSPRDSVQFIEWSPTSCPRALLIANFHGRITIWTQPSQVSRCCSLLSRNSCIDNFSPCSSFAFVCLFAYYWYVVEDYIDFPLLRCWQGFLIIHKEIMLATLST